MSEKYLHEMIDDIEILIDEAKPARFNPGRLVIDRDVLITVIEELRKQIPGEVERSHKVMMNKDAILEDARIKAQNIVNQAAREAGELIDENEIVEMAKMRAKEMEEAALNHANDVIHNANEEAEQVRYGALQYTCDIMEDVQDYITKVKEGQRSLFDQLLSTLDSDIESISTNYEEIRQQLDGASRTKVRTARRFRFTGRGIACRCLCMQRAS